MNNLNRYKLQNGITVLYRQNKNTPRTAVNVFFNSLNNLSLEAGVANVMSRLLLQGTKKHSAEEIADIIDNNGFEFNIDVKHDYIRLQTYFLDEDFDVASDLIDEVLKESTFEKVQKEISKLRGELTADLDSPRLQAFDNLAKNMFPNHYYGNTYTKILADIDYITKDQVIDAYKKLITNSSKVISVVGDFDEENVKSLLKKYFSSIHNTDTKSNIPYANLKETKLKKEDASQAQIIQGWHVPTIFDKDYPAIMVMNTMLGSSGLSSRLFLELRDKKGLAYVVRSSYEVYDKAALFNVYIATEPKNIKTSLEGFKIELDKIKNVPVSSEELENAKNNLIGKRQFFMETNLQQASMIAFYEDKGLGCDYEEKLINLIKNVTIEDVQRVANLCIKDPYVLTVLAPKEYLAQI